MDTLLMPLLFLLIVLGATLELISLFRSTGKVDFDYSISTEASEPETPIEVITEISNKSILPISYLAIKEVFPITATLPIHFEYDTRFDGNHLKRICRISSRSRKKIVLETSINKRGVYSFKADSMEIGDFLGFKELTKDILTFKQFVIYPHRYESANLIDALSSFHGDTVAKRCLIRDPILTAGIREYTGSEPMREIHWSKSAQQGKLMVREFEYNRQLSVNLLLCVNDDPEHDTKDTEDLEDLDKCCSIARTICETLIAKDVPVSFFTNAHLVGKKGQDIWKYEVTAKDINGFLETLGRATKLNRSTLEQLLEFTSRASDPTSVSILITSKNTKNIESTVSRFTRTTGREVMLMKSDHFSQDTEHEPENEVTAA